MNAIISGCAGRALVGERGRWSLVSAYEEGPAVSWERRDLREVFREADDLEFVRVASVEEARAKLDAACDREEALLLALNLLDRELSEETRGAVAVDLEALLARGAEDYVVHVLFARPLGAAHDLVGAARLAQGERVRAFCAELARSQRVIEEVWLAWESVPAHLFQGAARSELRALLVRGGWFARLVRTRVAGEGPDAVVARMLVESALLRLKNFRQVVMQWVAPLRVARKTPAPEPYVEDGVGEEDAPGESGFVDRARLLERVERQKTSIVQALDRRDEARAREYVDQLVETQLRTPEGSKYAAMSLCDLAKKASDRGMFRLQLWLTTRALEVQPDDGWSWQQHSVALRRNGQHAESAEAARRARMFRPGAASLSAEAEALRSHGRLVEALALYDENVRLYPDDVVARNGRAEVLKALGRLPEALAAYEEIAQAHPDDVVVRNGRAEVLKALGRLPEALAAYEETARKYPEDAVVRNGMAHILVRMREWDRALALLPEDAYNRGDWIGLHIRGMLYLRRGQFDAARTVFERGVRDCPFANSRDFFRTALVMTSLRQNRPQEAAEELKAVTTPALATPARVLQLHAYGAMGDMRKAKRADDAIPKQVTGVVLDLRLELERRYIQKKPRQHDDAWVFEKELDMLADYALAA